MDPLGGGPRGKHRGLGHDRLLGRRYWFLRLAVLVAVGATVLLAWRELNDLIDDPPKVWSWASERYDNAHTWPERAWDWVSGQF